MQTYSLDFEEKLRLAGPLGLFLGHQPPVHESHVTIALAVISPIP